MTRPKFELLRNPFRCSLCDWKPVSPDSAGKDYKGLEAIVRKEFAIHVNERHPREDFSQAAARIVRDATEGQ